MGKGQQAVNVGDGIGETPEFELPEEVDAEEEEDEETPAAPAREELRVERDPPATAASAPAVPPPGVLCYYRLPDKLVAQPSGKRTRVKRVRPGILVYTDARTPKTASLSVFLNVPEDGDVQPAVKGPVMFVAAASWGGDVGQWSIPRFMVE